jgi:hypothetical protein
MSVKWATMIKEQKALALAKVKQEGGITLKFKTKKGSGFTVVKEEGLDPMVKVEITEVDKV